MSLKELFANLRNILKSSIGKLGIKNKIDIAFGKYILLTNTVTAGFLMSVGDILQQEIEYQRHMLPKRYDWYRLTRMTVIGLGYGPVHQYFYDGIDYLWPVPNVKSVLKKIAADQFVMSPICISYFFYLAGLMEGKKVQECTDEFTSKFWEVYTVDWCVWPPTQFINFYFLPVKYQVIYINTITMLYNVFLSYMKHREGAQEYLKQNLLKKAN